MRIWKPEYTCRILPQSYLYYCTLELEVELRWVYVYVTSQLSVHAYQLKAFFSFEYYGMWFGILCLLVKRNFSLFVLSLKPGTCTKMAQLLKMNIWHWIFRNKAVNKKLDIYMEERLQRPQYHICPSTCIILSREIHVWNISFLTQYICVWLS